MLICTNLLKLVLIFYLNAQLVSNVHMVVVESSLLKHHILLVHFVNAL